MEQKKKKKFLILKTIAFESGTRNSQIPEQDIFIGSQYVTNDP